MATLYMGGTPETVGKYVLFSGDPWRVNVHSCCGPACRSLPLLSAWGGVGYAGKAVGIGF